MSSAAQRAKRREEVDYVYGEVTKAAAWVSIIIIVIITILPYGVPDTHLHVFLNSRKV